MIRISLISRIQGSGAGEARRRGYEYLGRLLVRMLCGLDTLAVHTIVYQVNLGCIRLIIVCGIKLSEPVFRVSAATPTSC